MSSISLLVPTRERPDQLLRMVKSAFENAHNPDALEIVIYVDADDEASQQLDTAPYNVHKLVGPKCSMGAMNTACYAASKGDVVALGNDDVVIQTKDWDKKILDLANGFADSVFLLYPNDLYKGEKLASFPIMSRKTCDEIAEPFPEEYRGAFIDLHIMDIFRRLQGAGQERIMFVEDVVFEHLHFRAGKADNDDTYINRDRFGDDDVFIALTGARDWAASRLLNIIHKSKTKTLAKPDAMQSHPGAWFMGRSLQVLLNGSAKFQWRLKLFVWLWARFVYRNVSAVLR